MRKGFTLLEILIVIGISAALLSFGALSLNGLRSGRSIESEARQLVAVLQNAQERSIGQDEGSRWGVTFDTSSQRHSYSLYQASTTIITSDIQVLKTGLQISLAAPVTSTVVFEKASGVPEAATTITISDGNPDTAKNVTVSAQGRIDY